MKTILSLFLFFFVSANILFAQKTSSLCLVINPTDAFVKIDGTVHDLKNKSLPYCIEIAVGSHPIEIWSPYFEAYLDTVQVLDRKANSYNKSLKTVSSEYSSFLEQQNAYNTKKSKRAVNLTLLGVANAGLLTIIAAPIGNRKLKKLKDETNDAKMEYNTNLSLDNISLAESRFEIKRDDYNKQKRLVNFTRGLAIPALAGTLYVTWKYLKKVRGNKLTKPTFEAPKNPYTFQINVDPNYRSVGMNMSFSF